MKTITAVHTSMEPNNVALRAMPSDLEPVGYMLSNAMKTLAEYLASLNDTDSLSGQEVTFDFSDVYISQTEAFEILSLTKRYEVIPKFLTGSSKSWKNLHAVANTLAGFRNYKDESGLEYKEFLNRMFDLSKHNLVSKPASFVLTSMISNIKQPLLGKKVYIIDLYNFIFRNYHGMPRMSNSAGDPTNVIKALINYVKVLEAEERPDFIIFAAEGDSKTINIRKKIYPEYKANREEPDEEVLFQIPIVMDLIEKMGFHLSKLPGFEGDDILIAFAREFEKLGADVIINSSDKDIMQVISDKIKVFDPMKHILKDAATCIEKFGVPPELVPDALALIGDTSDNIPGVHGIGGKGAAKLLQEYGSIDGIYANIDQLKGKQKENLVNGKDSAYLSLRLAQTHDYIVKDLDLEEYVYPQANPLNFIRKDLAKFEIKI